MSPAGRVRPTPGGAAAAPRPADPLADVAPALRCPHCHGALERADASLRCAAGHGFDVARQGWVALLARPTPHRGDAPAMLDARATVLDAGLYGPLTGALVATAARHAGLGAPAAPAPGGLPAPGPPLVLDVGAGTGHHLAALLRAAPASWRGVAFDVARAALSRCVRAHPAIAGVRGDVWQDLPLRDGAAHVVLVGFSPRNGSELARVLHRDGALVVASPAPEHLAELRERLPDAVGADPGKAARLRRALGALEVREERTVEFPLHVDAERALALVGMGPSARHVDVAAARARLDGGVATRAAIRVGVFAHPR